MIRKLIRLKNVARFRNEAYSFELSDFNLVLAENGCGKTTLSAIMHSAAKNEPGYITERETVDSDGRPEVQILTSENGRLQFSDREWDESVEEVRLDVFDSHFVNENIFSGHILSHEHKKRLHRFVIGEKGQAISNRIDRLDSLSRDLTGHIRSIEKKIEQDVGSKSFSADEYLQLPEPQNLQERIEQTNTLLDDLREADEIRSEAVLTEPAIPEIAIDELEDLLGTTLDDISEAAESTVREHISHCMDEEGENWIESGLSYMRDDSCPFCGQDLEDRDLIGAYQDYFSDEYDSLKSEVDDMLRRISSKVLPENGWRSTNSTLSQNQSQFNFWSDRIESSHDIPDGISEQLEDVWSGLRNALVQLLKQKQASPLDEVDFGGDTQDALDAYQSLQEELRQYREAVSEINEEIESFKSQLESGSLTEAEEKFAHLRACQFRYSEEGKDLSLRLRLNRKRKEDVNDAKQEARQELDEHQSSLLNSCQQGVNEFLRKAGADFRIRKTNVGYQGGSPNTRFSIEVNQQRIGIGNAVTEVGEQSFRNLLSEGDRTTLAFAFFYARIREADDLDERTLVLDDPISSLDRHRRDATRDAVVELSKRAQQTILLSHRPTFLHSVLQKRSDESGDDTSLGILRIRRTGDHTSEIEEWSSGKLIQEIRDPYFDHFERLLAFNESREGDPEAVARSIRYVLEGNLYRRFPDYFGSSNESVGAFVQHVKDVEDEEPFSYLKETEFVEELDAILDSAYCHAPHHSGDPFMPKQITGRGLKPWVDRTLKVVRGLPQ